MKSIIKLKDSEVGKISIVISKIRDYYKSFSSVVITYDNGNTRSIESDNLDEMINQLDQAVEEFYKSK
ncbi:MAG: hypothetical protein K0B81_04560 [Candidatus Cloacimonetes bacterium]|nr:hypothetical protein [Candidatus Cloacimonadota bacterium]